MTKNNIIDLELEIGYMPTRIVGDKTIEAQLVEVSVDSKDIPKILKANDRAIAKYDIEKFETSEFMKNPVISLDHDYSKSAIGKVIKITKEKNKLIVDVEYNPEFLKKIKKERRNAKNLEEKI